MDLTKFVALTSTADGALTLGKVYQGQFVRGKTRSRSGTFWRVKAIDNRTKFQTFDPDVFAPVKEGR